MTEEKERKYLTEHPEEYENLYPNLNDPNFNSKIASKKEFHETKYDGTIHENIKEYANKLSKMSFVLQPHQMFVKNFMSFQTPYNSLLLFHSLGTGKTCSSIGICEEMRDYSKQIGNNKKIIIVASENVLDNFRLQLFDERQLILVDGYWNIQGCLDNKLLNEINPMNMKGLSKENIVRQINSLINQYYTFLGYGQFANYIIKTMSSTEENKLGKELYSKKKYNVELDNKMIQRLRREFNDRLIVIDEIHNIRKTDENSNKKVAINLEILVKHAENLRFVFLSATPMYNNYKEIIWLLNIMNINDRRSRVNIGDIFDKQGNFKPGGEELFIRKATGYVSFVRGENPYTFPYRVYPLLFSPEHSFSRILYPSYQMNMKKIKEADKLKILDIYVNTIKDCNKCGICQGCCYHYIIYYLRQKELFIGTQINPISLENMEKFGYTILQTPIESLIISYPMKELTDILPQLQITEQNTIENIDNLIETPNVTIEAEGEAEAEAEA